MVKVSEKFTRFRIARVFGAYYEIFNPTEGRVLAKLRGNIRIQSKDERHPFVVGDFVLAEKKSDTWMIQSKEDRSSILVRKSNNRDAHALCANADYAIVLASLKNPETKIGFIDRFLAAVSSSGMTPIIVFTKKDLVNSPQDLIHVEFYVNLGYSVFLISIYDPDSYKPLRDRIKGKASFISGNSGVGKSTLVNLLIGEEIQATNNISETTNKGKHTTTNSSAFFLSDGTVIIDSPGIKEWGILHLDAEEVLLSMPELQRQREDCDEEHCCTMEEGCPMLDKIDTLSDERRSSLENMLSSLEKPFRTTRRDLWEAGERD